MTTLNDGEIIADSSKIVALLAERDDALAELAQWRANHDDQVRRKQAVQVRYEVARDALKEIHELYGGKRAGLIAWAALCYGSVD